MLCPGKDRSLSEGEARIDNTLFRKRINHAETMTTLTRSVVRVEGKMGYILLLRLEVTERTGGSSMETLHCI
jgi:hypothetical protein